MKTPAQIQGYAARVLMVSFFIPMKMQVGAIALCMLVFLWYTFREKALIDKRKLIQALLIGSGLILCIGGAIITAPEYQKEAWGICERKVSLLLIPLLLAIISPRCRQAILSEQSYFVIGCAILCISGNLQFLWHFGFFSGHISVVNHVAYRQYLEWVTGIHPTYLGMYLAFALSLIMCSEGDLSTISRPWRVVLFYFLLLCLLASLAKSPMLAFVLILLHAGWENRRNLMRYKYHLLGGVLLLGATYIFVPFFRERLAEMVQIGNQTGAADVHANSINERKMILHTDLSALHTYWLTGAGPAKLQQVLDARYLMYSIHNGVVTGFYDPHSEYLWQWLTFGIAGIIVFVALLLYLVCHAIRSKNRMFLYMMTLVIITFFTESLLARQHGVVFFSLFAALYLFMADDQEFGRVQ